MKNSLRISSIVVLTTVVLVFASNAFGQRVGGYKAIAANDSAAHEAAEFAVSTQAEKSGKSMTLVSVTRAERQVVAGSNYRLCLKVNSEGGEGQDDVTIFVQAVVYVDLKGNKKLTSWTIADCGDEGDGD
jgi:cystatin-C